MLYRENNGIWSTYKNQWPVYVQDLPRTLDRFRTASVFFDLKFPSFLSASLDARKWTSWASIAALISIKEVLEMDLEDLGYLEKWKKSNEYDEIQNSEIFLVLKELRNYEVHIEFYKRISHSEVDKSTVIENVDQDSFFFAPISWQELAKLRNIKSGRSLVTQEMVEKFNEEYAKKYSVETIIKSSMDWYAERIYQFLKRMKSIKAQEHGK